MLQRGEVQGGGSVVAASGPRAAREAGSCQRRGRSGRQHEGATSRWAAHKARKDCSNQGGPVPGRPGVDVCSSVWAVVRANGCAGRRARLLEGESRGSRGARGLGAGRADGQTGRGGDICSERRLGKRSLGVVGVGPGAKTYPVKGARCWARCGTGAGCVDGCSVQRWGRRGRVR